MSTAECIPCVPTKHCSRCKEPFPATTEYFYKQADRLTSACVLCYRIIQNGKRAANPSRYRAYDATRRAKDPGKHRAKGRNDYAKHRSKRRARQSTWEAAHRVYRNSYQRTWYKTNPEKASLSRLIRKGRRRAAQLQCAINDLTRQQWQQIKTHYGFLCVYCGKKPKRLEQDHIIPLSNGGNHTASNIVPACRSCNAKKGTGPVLKPIQLLLFI